MKYIVFSYEGEGFPVAWQLHREGNDVTVGMIEDGADTLAHVEKGSGEEDPERKIKRLRLYDGLLKKVPARTLIKEMQKIPDPQNYFVFCEMNLTFKFAEQARDMGFHGNFPTEEDYCFELDRQKAKDFVTQYYTKLKFIETKSFTRVADAKEFIMSSSELWVAKGYDPDSVVIIPETNNPDTFRKQLCTELDKSIVLYERSGFLLERYIKNLIEITPERLYYDGTLLSTTIDIENKQIGSGNISLITGCASDLVFPISNDSKICQIAFPPIVDELAQAHKGLFFWDASLLIDADTDEIYFGEFCPNRPGYNEFLTQLAQMPSITHFFEQITKKQSPHLLGTFGASTRLFNMNRSIDDTCILADLAIQLENEKNRHILLWDVYKKDHELVTSGYDINVAIATGTGKTIREAVDHMATNIDQISFGRKYYRPSFDYLSRAYPSAILNRITYALKKNLFTIPQVALANLPQ